MQGEIHILSQGGGSRRSAAGTTASLATDAAANLDIPAIGSKSYVLHAIQTSGSAWVTVYTDTQSRTNDANRQITTDPVAGGGVIAECVTVGGTMQILTPAPNGFNADGIYGNNPSSNIYVKVVNRHTSAAAVTVTLKYLPLEY